MSIIIKDTIPGCGKSWNIQPVLDRMSWLSERFQSSEYRSWYEGLHSDDLYIEFVDPQNALMYKIMWCNIPVDSNSN